MLCPPFDSMAFRTEAEHGIWPQSAIQLEALATDDKRPTRIDVERARRMFAGYCKDEYYY
eukprot:5589344-Ditylum_brightwellii.AAC.1